MRPLSIEGAWVNEPVVHADHRGELHECYGEEAFRASVGHGLRLAQANWTVSRRGTLRGVHFADVPPGQAKYVQCVRGAVLDVVVDVRTGSPTYRQWEAVRLDDANRRSLYLAEGLGHGFMALTDDATVMYLCSQPYAPQREHGLDPFDPELGIDWPSDITPLLSEKDAAAPSLAEAERLGVLPSYEACLAHYAAQREGARA
ncbi:dTDP-4-dehydrorhamnose 3,5-epimerase [Streptomyces sp. NPDC049577]|uniref:dTDP-4-dehydrorhamnose 3,5-epimerase n=1 Tax=Streptomyces sp. NPDC049577 TaxID=3155153 RepID=UPI00342DC56D